MAQFLADADVTYGAAIRSRTNLSRSLQQRIGALASRIEQSRVDLKRIHDYFEEQVREELAALQARSVRLRRVGIILLITTLLISAALVDFTIRHTVTRPLVRAQNDLAHERDLLRILMDSIPDLIYFKDTDCRFVRINRAQSAAMGLDDPSQAYGRTDFDFFDPETARNRYRGEREILRSTVPLMTRVESLGSPDSPTWLTTTKVAVKDESGKVQGIVSVSRDITEWKQTMEALQESEEYFRLLFATIPHAVWVYDPETLCFLVVNDTAARHYGYTHDEFCRLKITAIHALEETDRLLSALTNPYAANPAGGTWKHVTKSGDSLDVEVSAHAFTLRGRRAVLAVSQDVSERKRLETELQQAQRLESVGQLAAGIAHEINTPIQYVSDNLRFLEEAFGSRQQFVSKSLDLQQAAQKAGFEPEVVAELEQIVEDGELEYLNDEIPKALAQSVDGVERVATIVRAMKEFAHPGYKEKTAADLNKSLTNALVVARNEIKYVADVETDFGNLPPVLCHIADLNQVFLNLLINAADAIREVAKNKSGKKGLIRVQTRHSGDQAVICISDTGCGIPESIQRRVFDPFFTTKEVGKGSGQGWRSHAPP